MINSPLLPRPISSTFQNGVMSLPGLGLEEPEEVHKVESSRYDLGKESEWRFEVGVGKYTQVKVGRPAVKTSTTLTKTGRYRNSRVVRNRACDRQHIHFYSYESCHLHLARM